MVPVLTRKIFGVGSALLAGFALLCLLLSVPRTDDTNLRTLILPPTCDQPCLLGLQPGETTTQEAIEMLVAHPWIEPRSLERVPDGLRWFWNGEQPDFLQLSGGYVLSSNDVVQLVQVQTRIPRGRFRLLLTPDSRPLHLGMPYSISSRAIVDSSDWYLDDRMEVSSTITCPAGLGSVLRAPGQVTLYANRQPHSIREGPKKMFRSVCNGRS